jgi:2',3'-cyclic-nucleotide 2'-phosphodiesterase (5'-nucleotidase family)
MFRVLRYTLFCVILNACAANLNVSDTRASHYELKSLTSDSIAQISISPYKETLDKEMVKVIAYSDSALTKEGPEPVLGNFVSMAVEEYIDNNYPEFKNNYIIILNRGGLRNNLPQGPVTKNNIYELMPFDNEITILTISGQKLMDGLKAMTSEKKLFSNYLNMLVKDKIPEEIFIHGKPFDIAQNYVVITTDYLAMGGDNCSFFAKPLSYKNTGVKLRDAIIGYCDSLTKNNKTIKPLRFGNIRISK